MSIESNSKRNYSVICTGVDFMSPAIDTEHHFNVTREEALTYARQFFNGYCINDNFYDFYDVSDFKSQTFDHWCGEFNDTKIIIEIINLDEE